MQYTNGVVEERQMEDSKRQQCSDAQRRENILFMRLATKEQEVQEFYVCYFCNPLRLTDRFLTRNIAFNGVFICLETWVIII